MPDDPEMQGRTAADPEALRVRPYPPGATAYGGDPAGVVASPPAVGRQPPGAEPHHHHGAPVPAGLEQLGLGAGLWDAADGALALTGMERLGGLRAGLGLGITRPLGLVGAISGAVGGVNHIRNGDTSQGVLDLVASGATAVGSAPGLMSASSTLMGGGAATGLGAGLAASAAPLAVAGGAAALAAYGNPYATERGWYGRQADGTPRTFLGSVGADAESGWSQGNATGRRWLGDNAVGRTLGYAMGTAQAGESAWNRGRDNTGAAMWGGVRRIGEGVGEAVRSVLPAPDTEGPAPEAAPVPQISAPRRGSIQTRAAQAAAMQAVGATQRPEDLE